MPIGFHQNLDGEYKANMSVLLQLAQSLPFRVSFATHADPKLLPLPQPFSSVIAGLPRGRISEVVGSRSSGRTGLIHTILAESVTRGEICALVDCTNSFDPTSAVRNGVALEQLLWVRCDRRLDNGLKATDVFLHTDGFGVVVLDLYDVAPSVLRRISLSWWYRFRKAVENTSTILLITASESVAGSCASCVIAMEYRGAQWSGSAHTPLLAGLNLESSSRKPVHTASISLHASLAG
jgi:hypothetical protein